MLIYYANQSRRGTFLEQFQTNRDIHFLLPINVFRLFAVQISSLLLMSIHFFPTKARICWIFTMGARQH